MGKFCIGVGLMIFMWCLTFAYAQKIEAYTGRVDLHYTQEKVGLDQLEVLQEYEKYKFVAWNELKEKAYENPSLERMVKGDMMQVYGDLDQLIPQDRLQGQLIIRGDSDGMLITSALAYDLWGSEEVVGKKLNYEDKTYNIRGIIEDDRVYGVTLVEPDQEEKTFGVLRLDLEGEDNIPEIIEMLAVKYQLPKGVMDNIALKTTLLSQLTILPLWLVVGCGLLKFYNFIYKYHRYYILGGILSIGAVLTTYGTLKLLPISLNLPSYILPNKWSDIRFWSWQIEKASVNQEAFKRLPTTIPSQWIQYSDYLVVGSLALVLTVIFIKYVKVETVNQLFWQVLSAIILTFVCIIGVSSLGYQLVIIQGLWLVVPFYLVVRLILKGLESLIAGWENEKIEV